MTAVEARPRAATVDLVSCPICASNASFELHSAGYDLYRCVRSGCGHGFVHPMPSDAELSDLYAGLDPSIANADGLTLAADYRADPDRIRAMVRRTRVDWLAERVPDFGRPGLRCLDVGCSTGVFLRVMADLAEREVVGVDISPDACAFVTDEFGIECHGSLDEVADGAFDLVTCYAILEHAADPLAMLRSAARKLGPGGRLYVLVPNYESLYRRTFPRSWVWLIPPVHLHYFTPRSMKRLLAAAGLEATDLDTGYSGTYLYLVVHHLMRALGRSMPSTSRTGRGSAATALIGLVETALRVAFLPARAAARVTDRGNEIRLLATRSSALPGTGSAKR